MAFLVTVVSVSQIALSCEWELPANPDPIEILAEVRQDIKKGEYEDALAKEVWLYEHSLEHQPSFAGVRASSVLSTWLELADVYPPALEKLREIRDSRAKRVKKLEGEFRSHFMDFVDINEKLDDQKLTVELFSDINKKNSKKAEIIYYYAQDALINAGEFKICGSFLDPENRFPPIMKLYERLRKRELHRDAPERERLSLEADERFLLEFSSKLIALLVLNERRDEAEEIASKVISASRHANKGSIVDAALQGKFPSPEKLESVGEDYLRKTDAPPENLNLEDSKGVHPEN